MPALCDIHNHLLHDVDDGCTSMAETLRHLREFRSQGVTELCFTPHLLAADLDRTGIEQTLALHRRRFQEVVEATRDDPDVPALFLGQEILARRGEDLDAVVGRTDVGLGGGAALLVELGFRPGFDAEGVIRRVVAEGRQIVLAHPERYRYGDHEDPVASAEQWREWGAVLQVNGGSLAGLYTESANELATRLLEEGLVDVVASDHHGDYRAHAPALIAEALVLRGAPASVPVVMGSAPRQMLVHAGAIRV